jgi:hypothetical protein
VASDPGINTGYIGIKVVFGLPENFTGDGRPDGYIQQIITRERDQSNDDQA